MRKFVYDGRDIGCAGFLGLGQSTIGICEYLKKKYPRLPLILRSDREINPDVQGRVNLFDEIYCGESAFSNIHEDIIFTSPSVRRDRRELDPFRRSGVVFSSDAELFFRFAEMPIFSVSGSDGKSTTATLAAMMMTEGNRSAAALGNIGVAMAPYINSSVTAAVAELSSFQLMNFEPTSRRAIITNISPNHLDWHTSFDEYTEAKKNIMKRASERVFNLDCPICRELAAELKADIAYSTTLSETDMRKAVRADCYICLQGTKIRANGVEILDTGAIKRASRHNFINFTAAIALTYGYASRSRIYEVANEFSGLGSRCESIGTFDGVEYIDSSIDSTPRRTVTTLLSLPSSAIVIIGGRSKRLDYSELIPTLCDKAKAVVLTGEVGEELLPMLKSTRELEVPYIYIADFDGAVKYAAKIAKSGDTVILSPASTSFDCFKNYRERAERFKHIIYTIYKK